jgi:pilus assembly protein TadC
MEFTPFTDFTDQIGGIGNPTLVKGPQSRFYFDGRRLFNVIPSFFCGVRIVFVLSLLLSLIVIIIVIINIFRVLIFRARFLGNPAIGNVIVSGLS